LQFGVPIDDRVAIGASAGLLAPYIMGSVVETAATPLAGFNTGFMICGVIMLAGGLIGMALIRPERDAGVRAAPGQRIFTPRVPPSSM